MSNTTPAGAAKPPCVSSSGRSLILFPPFSYLISVLLGLTQPYHATPAAQSTPAKCSTNSKSVIKVQTSKSQPAHEACNHLAAIVPNALPLPSPIRKCSSSLWLSIKCTHPSDHCGLPCLRPRHTSRLGHPHIFTSDDSHSQVTTHGLCGIVSHIDSRIINANACKVQPTGPQIRIESRSRSSAVVSRQIACAALEVHHTHQVSRSQ
jgi:hypothetical protein